MNESSTSSPSLTERSTLLRLFDRYTLDQFRGAKIETADLSSLMRSLVWLGYAVVIALVLLAFVLERLGDNAGAGVSFATGLTKATYQVPTLALWITFIGYAIGWAFALAGAVFARRAIFVVVCILFVLLNVAGLSQSNTVTELAFVPLLGIPALAVVLRLLRTRVPALNPFVVTLLIGLATVFSTVQLITSSPPADSAKVADTLFVFLNVLAYPIWVLGGLSLIAFGISIGRSIVRRLRDSMSEGSLKRLIAIVLVSHLLIGGAAALVLFGGGIGAAIAPMVALDAALSLPIVLAMMMLMASKRWTGPSAALLLGARVALFVFTLAFLISDFSGFNVADPVNSALDKLAILPPSLFFMGGIALGMLGFFVPFANAETNKLPRTARIPLALGCAILLIGMMFFLSNAVGADNGDTLAGDSFFGTLFFLGVVLLGLPYLLFTLLRRKQNLIGEAADWAQVPQQPNRPHRAAVAFVLLMPAITLLCAFGMFIGSFFFGMGKQ